MAITKFITQRQIDLQEAIMSDEFFLFNMCPAGVWLVDKQYPEFERIKEVALKVAITFKDSQTILTLQNL